MKTSLLIILTVCVISPQLLSQSKISDRLQESLLDAQVDNSAVRTIVVLNDQVDIVNLDQQLYEDKSSLENRAYSVIILLKEKAKSTQNEIISFLQSKPSEEVVQYRSFWIINMLMVEAVPAVIYELAEKPGVMSLDLDGKLDWDRPTNEMPSSTRANSSEIGLRRINAHKMWQLGYTGAGTIVMNLDWGVDGNHPALTTRWRGSQSGVPYTEAWFDPDGSTFPYDPHGHGTHTMGTLTGLDSNTNDTVGVAFGAEWIAARTIGASGDLQSNNVAAYQWAMDPDGNPGSRHFGYKLSRFPVGGSG